MIVTTFFPKLQEFFTSGEMGRNGFIRIFRYPSCHSLIKIAKPFEIWDNLHGGTPVAHSQGKRRIQ